MANVSVLHKLLHMFQGRLLESLYTEATTSKTQRSGAGSDGDVYDFAVEEQFFQILDELGEPDGARKAQARAQDLPETVNFLLPPDKSGFLSARGRLLKKRGPKKRFWFVLSGSFLHYFTNPADTRPHRSVPVEELSVLTSSVSSQVSVTTGDMESCSFTITYMRKEHTLYCESLEEVLDWTNVIETAKRKRWCTDDPPTASNTKHMGKMELRVQRHLTGLKQSYECNFVGFEVDTSGVLVSDAGWLALALVSSNFLFSRLNSCARACVVHVR
jgi:PH domain